MPSLELLLPAGPLPAGHQIPLDFTGRTEIALGRVNRPGDIRLDDGLHAVGRRHAVLTARPGGVWVENFGRNGTLLNGREISGLGPQPLRPGDLLAVCDFLFRLHADDAADEPVVGAG